MVSLIALVLITVILVVGSLIGLGRVAPKAAKKIFDVKEPTLLMIYVIAMFFIAFTITIMFADVIESLGLFPY